MSALSSVANAVLGVISGSGKVESKTAVASAESSFLALIDSSNVGFNAQQNQQDLVDSLYKKEDPKEDDVAAIAAPQVPNAVFVDKREKAVNSQRENQTDLENGNTSDVQSNNSPETNNGVRSEKPDQTENRAENDVGEAAAKTDAEAPVQAAEKPAENTIVSDGSVAGKLRQKINELSDMLSSILGLLAPGSTVTVTVVSITQTTTTNGVDGFGATAFLDLSDRFKQLISAVESAQNLGGDVRQSLSSSFSSFQAIFASQTTTVNGPQTSSIEAFFAQSTGFEHACLDCEKNLQFSTASLASFSSLAGASDTTDLQNAFGSLSDILKDFRSLIEQVKNPTALPKFVQPVSVQPVSVLSADAVSNRVNNAPLAVDVKPSDAVTDAAIVNNSQIASQTPNTASPASTNTNTAVATMLGNGAGGNQNFSNNSGGSGQGGERAATPVIAGNISATSASEHSASANFAKSLKAAISQPVAEQILVQVKTAVKNGDSKIEIRLDPAELGKLTIKLETSSDGKTGISIVADSKSTLDLLQRDVRSLQQALADAGLRPDSGSLSFNLRGGNQQQQEQQQASSGYKKMQPEEELIPLAAITRSYTLQMNDGLDIRI